MVTLLTPSTTISTHISRIQTEPLPFSKLVILGHSGSGKHSTHSSLIHDLGKTALLRKLESKKCNIHQNTSTIGFDVGSIQISKTQKLVFWDFAGQIEYDPLPLANPCFPYSLCFRYLSMHKYFLRQENSTLFVVTIDATSKNIEGQTTHWLQLIRECCPLPNLSFVVTKMDLISIDHIDETKSTITHYINTVWTSLFTFSFDSPPTIFFISCLNLNQLKTFKDHLEKLSRIPTVKTPPVFREYDRLLALVLDDPTNTKTIITTKKIWKKLKSLQPQIEAETHDDPIFLSFLDFQGNLGLILYDKKHNKICLNPSALSKSMAIFLAPQAQFLDGKSGKESLIDGGLKKKKTIFGVFDPF